VGKFGWTGVDLFFVLSGYLISSQLFLTIAQSKKISFRNFFIKRFFRIIPAYLVVVAIYFFVPSFHEREALSPLWRFLTFTQNFGLDISIHGTFSHSWSLCIEEQFYLLLPLILIALVYYRFEKIGAFILLFLFIAGFAARLYSWHTFLVPLADTDEFEIAWLKWMYYPTYNRLDGLIAGVSIAALFQFRPWLKERLTKYGNWLLVISLVVLTAAYFLCEEENSFEASIFGFPVVAIGYGLLLMSAISPTSFLYKFNSRITATIANLSFALYLTHKGLIHITQTFLVGKMNIKQDSNTSLLLCVVVCLLGAWLLNRIIERPFLKLRQSLLAKK
jgi:peptidoglycan/LPS O-acetylase OafA/YrhL